MNSKRQAALGSDKGLPLGAHSTRGAAGTHLQKLACVLFLRLYLPAFISSFSVFIVAKGPLAPYPINVSSVIYKGKVKRNPIFLDGFFFKIFF